MRPRSPRLPLRLLGLGVVALLLAGCQTTSPEPSPSATAPAFGAAAPGGPAPIIRASPQDALTPVSDQPMTVSGLVRSVSDSDKAIKFADATEGIDTIQITPATRFVGLDGKDGTFADVKEGQTIETTGLPSKTGALVAREVRVTRGN